jgi:predicted Zn-dependent protease
MNSQCKVKRYAFKSSTTLNPQVNYRYAQILMALNRNQKAYDKLEPVIKSGRATPEMVAVFEI